jgi:uncharacterized protein YfaQ (DUF2300 family)
MALLLQRSERLSDASAYWRRYLALDGASAWAAGAQRARKYCEMRIAQSS